MSRRILNWPHLARFGLLALAATTACDGVADVARLVTATGGADAGGGVSVANGSGGSGGAVPTKPTEIAACQGHVYECGDLVDNDMDGLVDSQDPDCLGPCDDTEDSFFGGISGQNQAPCKQDCYWDQDTGHGNDSCYWDHSCDPLSVAPNYYPEVSAGDKCAFDPDTVVSGISETCGELQLAQPDECADVCGPLTPNGCDCFGCCELPSGGGQHIWLGSVGAANDTVCTSAEIDNPAVCHPCTPVASCFNPCGECEICAGKTSVPPECDGDDPPGQQCEEGVVACGIVGQPACSEGTYCISGCCRVVPK